MRLLLFRICGVDSHLKNSYTYMHALDDTL